MRSSLLLMLVVSLALHVALAMGIALSSFAAPLTKVAATAEKPIPTLELLRLRDVPISPLPIASQPILASAYPVTPNLVTRPAAPAAETKPAPAAPPPSVALEANPNAQIRALPPEAVLSPSPAPRLDAGAAVVFVLDISGSMYEPYAGSTRLAFARQAMSERIRALPNGTPFAVALYAARACLSGPLVAASDATREAAVRYIGQDVDCGGGTNLPAGLALAQRLQAGRLVLMTDGDLNCPQYELLNAEREILGGDGSGPSLTILAVGPRPNTGAEEVLRALVRQEGGTCLIEQFKSETTLLTSAAGATKPVAVTP